MKRADPFTKLVVACLLLAGPRLLAAATDKPSEEWELDDLKNDPQEMASLYADPAQAKRIAKQKTELERLREHYQVPDDHR